MKSTQLNLRCFGEKKEDLWSVVCVDLCLAAQHKSLEKAKANLQEQVKEYLFDALVGEDSEHAEELLNRKAPLSIMFKYHWIGFLNKLNDHKERAKSILFTQSMPLRPC